MTRVALSYEYTRFTNLGLQIGKARYPGMRINPRRDHDWPRESGLHKICRANSADDERYFRLEGLQRSLRLDLLFEISPQPSMIGAPRHLLYVGKK